MRTKHCPFCRYWLRMKAAAARLGKAFPLTECPTCGCVWELKEGENDD